MAGFPQNTQATAGGTNKTLMSVASNNIRYQDNSVVAIATGTTSARSAACFRFVPKALGEIVISVDAFNGVGAAGLVKVFSSAAVYDGGIGFQGSGSPVLTSFNVGTLITTPDISNNANLQASSNSYGTIQSASTTFTFTVFIATLAPIFIGWSATSSVTITMTNFKVSYDLIRV